MDGKQVNDLLRAQAESVCRHLLPNGRREKSEWITGDIHDVEGQSLRIHLEGAKCGWWADFSDVEHFRGKNLLSLWMAVRCPEDFKKALHEAKEFLGVRENDSAWRRAGVQKKNTASPSDTSAAGSRPRDGDLKSEFVPIREGGKIWKWLTEVRRISAKAIAAYRIGESHDGRLCVFPFYDQAGELKLLKFRDPDAKDKMFVKPQGGPKLLFGIQAIAAKQSQLPITEGELDAMSMWQYGLPAVSVPFGAKWAGSDGKDPNDEWIQHDYEFLEPFTEIYLSLDNDEPGQKATESLIPRLGRERCLIVDFPAGLKDANDCLINDVDQDEFIAAMGRARDADPAELKSPSDFEKKIWDRIYPVGGIEPGDATPWPMPFRFRQGEVTVWTGFSKHGKTALLSYLLAYWADKGRRSCIASLEIQADMTLQNILRQSTGIRKPNEVQFHEAIKWMDRFFWIYDHVGAVKSHEILEVFSYAAKKYGVHHFVVDSLMRLDVDEEDNHSQKVFMNQLTAFAMEFNVHVHLVAHSKKPDSKHPEKKHWPGKHDVRGSVHITDIAHNTICVYRNKLKEEELQTVGSLPDEAMQQALRELAGVNDALFIVLAQRGGNGEEPIKQLWFDHEESWQYRDVPNVVRENFVAQKKPEQAEMI